jgi:WD40 repeat protein
MSRLGKVLPRRQRRARPRHARLSADWQAQIEDHVIALGWSPDGAILAAGAVSGPVTLFQGASGAIQHRLTSHNFGTTALAWHPSGALLATAGQDGCLRLWDAATGVQQAELAGGASWVEHLAWSPDGRLLAAAAGRVVRLWDEQATLVAEFGDHPSTIGAIGWRPTGAPLLAVAAYNLVTLYKLPQGSGARRLKWHGSPLALSWSPDGHSFATGEQDATMHFWMARQGKELQMWGYQTKVRELAWDHRSRWLASGGGEQVTVWDCAGAKGPEGRNPRQLIQHEDAVTALAYQHEGPFLASGAYDGRVVLWQPEAHRSALCEATFEDSISCLSWAPGDARLAVGDDGGYLSVLRVHEE